MEAIGVGVAHDDGDVARAVGEVIEAAPDLFVAGTSPDAGAVVVAGGEALASMGATGRPVVALASNGSLEAARAALAIGARDLIRWPDEASLLAGAVRRAARPSTTAAAAPVIAIAGARGGAGTSTVAGLLAARLAGALVLDLDPAGAGVRALCADEEPPTWERLGGASDVRGDVLESVLSAHGKASRALQAPRLAAAPAPRAARALLRAARGVAPVVIADCGRAAEAGQAEVLGAAERKVLVAGDDVASVRGALALKERLAGEWALVVIAWRRFGVPLRDLSAALGVRPAVVLRRDAALARALDLGRVPPRASRPMRAMSRLAKGLGVNDG